MRRSLRGQLVLSHILTLLLLVPLLGVALVVTLEGSVLLPGLERALTGRARLFASLTADQPHIWQDAEYASAVLAQVSPEESGRVMLIDARGRLLASSDPQDQDRIGETLDIPGLPQALAGQPVSRTNISSRLHGDVVDVFLPVQSAAGELLGVVRMSQRYYTVAQEFLRLRYWILAILSAGLLLGAAAAWWTGGWISQPLEHIAQALPGLMEQQPRPRLEPHGPQELRRLVAAINLLSDRLDVLEDSRRTILASLVHELGRPLGAFRSALQFLRRPGQDDAGLRAELLAGMEQETLLLENLLEEMARLQEQVLDSANLRRTPLDLLPWLQRALKPWEAAAAEKQLTWQVDFPAALPLVQADPLRLSQALGNVVSNAIKYTPAGGQIAVTLRLQPGAVCIHIQDSGPGIPPAEQEHIFTPFYRVTQKDSAIHGTGLGLSIAREIMQAHGGAIEVHSAPGSGSLFILRLPLES